MSTWRELSVVAMKLATAGMSRGLTVTTVTGGAGRACGAGASLPQPVTTKAAATIGSAFQRVSLCMAIHVRGHDGRPYRRSAA